MGFESARQARRFLRRNAARFARKLATSSAIKGRDGIFRIVGDPMAQGALQRGFEAVLRSRGEPQVLALSADEAAALSPGNRAPEGARWFGGFGIDRDGRGAFETVWVAGPGLSPEQAADFAALRLHEMLGRSLAASGWVGGHE